MVAYSLTHSAGCHNLHVMIRLSTPQPHPRSRPLESGRLDRRGPIDRKPNSGLTISPCRIISGCAHFSPPPGERYALRRRAQKHVPRNLFYQCTGICDNYVSQPKGTQYSTTGSPSWRTSLMRGDCRYHHLYCRQATSLALPHCHLPLRMKLIQPKHVGKPVIVVSIFVEQRSTREQNCRTLSRRN